MRKRSEALLVLLCAAAGCVTPSRAEMAERDAEVRRLGEARAVHMPKGVDSCVGVTLRLSDPAAGAESVAERQGMATRISPEEVASAMEAAGVASCREGYIQAVKGGAAAAEPIALSAIYGVDPAGKVCAVVERERPEPIDPSGAPLVDGAAECLKNTLFRASFPAARVKDKERVVLTYVLAIDPGPASPAEAR